MHIRWTPAAFSDLKAISQRIELARNLATANWRSCYVRIPERTTSLVTSAHR